MTTKKLKGLTGMTIPSAARVDAIVKRTAPDAGTPAEGTTPEIEAFVKGIKRDESVRTFSVTLNGTTYWANYVIDNGVISVVSEYGAASASASDESNYATAITLLFGILRAAD